MRKIKYTLKGKHKINDERNNRGKISECAGLWSWMRLSDAASIKKSIEKRRKLSRPSKKEKERLA